MLNLNFLEKYLFNHLNAFEVIACNAMVGELTDSIKTQPEKNTTHAGRNYFHQ